jgi:hypothetical protein
VFHFRDEVRGFFGRPAIVDGNAIDARLGKTPHDRPTNPARTPGHQSYSIFKFHDYLRS